jgi:tRNA uracil 4-sulfurtransferase
MSPADDVLLLTLGSEIYVKSDRTRRRFVRKLVRNLEEGLARAGVDASVETLDRGRLLVRTPQPSEALPALSATFGVHRVERGRAIDWSGLDDLAVAVADVARERVRGRTFAVRVKRSGEHAWNSPDAQRSIGTLLLADSAGVDLDEPEVEVRVLVAGQAAWVIGDALEGPGGMPLGTQARCLSLLSGGFDSPVAAWLVMRRGCPVEFLHVRLECAQSDHALAVAHELWRRWGAGTYPRAWVVDFTDVKAALESDVPARLRQVVLKQLMFRAADLLAEERGIPALVTGEAIGQVSSQTLHHMAEIDRSCSRTVLRPLTGTEKYEIVAKAHEIGTGELSARAQEVCDLAGSRVAVAARRPTLSRAHDELPAGLAEAAVRDRSVVSLADWLPGMDPVPLTRTVPPEATLVEHGRGVPAEGPLIVRGTGAVRIATRLAAAGRDVRVLSETSGTGRAA